MIITYFLHLPERLNQWKIRKEIWHFLKKNLETCFIFSASEEWKSRGLSNLVAFGDFKNDLDDSCSKRKKYKAKGARTPMNVAVVEEIYSCHHIRNHIRSLKDTFKKEEAENKFEVLKLGMVVKGRYFFDGWWTVCCTP